MTLSLCLSFTKRFFGGSCLHSTSSRERDHLRTRTPVLLRYYAWFAARMLDAGMGFHALNMAQVAAYQPLR